MLHTLLYSEKQRETRQVLAKQPILDHDEPMNVYYFDWAATSPISEQALHAYERTARAYRGNPSALHKEGITAAKALASERKRSASLLGVSEGHIHFTSGATESNAIVLQSLLWKRSPGRIILSAMEHDSVLQYQRLLTTYGFEVITIPAHRGYIDEQELAEALTENTQMVCIMLVNNVLGTVQNIPALRAIIRDYEQKIGKQIHIHCDAVQAVGKIAWSLAQLDIDSAAFSAHKFKGPRGTGMLYLKSHGIEALSRGGGQESGIRPGTESLAAIAAMNAALEETMEDIDATLHHLHQLRAYLEDRLAEHQQIVHMMSPLSSTRSDIAPSIVTLTVPQVPSEVLTRILYDQGFCVSSGSACSNNAPKGAKHVLVHNGFSPREAESAIRISFGVDTEQQHIDLLCEALIRESRTLLSIRRK
jgi:cysteine desulfurase